MKELYNKHNILSNSDKYRLNMLCTEIKALLKSYSVSETLTNLKDKFIFKNSLYDLSFLNDDNEVLFIINTINQNEKEFQSN